jgi:hypothetical protein
MLGQDDPGRQTGRERDGLGPPRPAQLQPGGGTQPFQDPFGVLALLRSVDGDGDQQAEPQHPGAGGLLGGALAADRNARSSRAVPCRLDVAKNCADRTSASTSCAAVAGSCGR